MTQELAELNRIFLRYREVAVSIRIEKYRVPLNREAEKQRFMEALGAKRIYNPRFTYERVPRDLEKKLAGLMKNSVVHGYWSGLLAETIEQKCETIRALRDRGADRLTRISTAIYGAADAALLGQAEHALRVPSSQVGEARGIDATSAAEIFRQVLDSADLPHWKVDVEPEMNARISVEALKEHIRIRADATFAPPDLNRLMIHEIGTHVFRAANGADQPLKLLSVGLGPYISTEEGLASVLEQRYGLTEPSDVRRHALRVIAVEASIRGSFFDAFSAISPYTSPDMAWETCIRTKRGLIDTSVPGAFTKDLVYVKGHQTVRRHLEAYPDDLTLLFAGKLGLEMLPAARELQEQGLLRPPLHQPDAVVAHFI